MSIGMRGSLCSQASRIATVFVSFLKAPRPIAWQWITICLRTVLNIARLRISLPVTPDTLLAPLIKTVLKHIVMVSGSTWETDPSVCTVCVTTKYDISCSEGKAELVNSCWGMIAGSIPADRFDELYSTCCVYPR